MAIYCLNVTLQFDRERLKNTGNSLNDRAYNSENKFSKKAEQQAHFYLFL